MTELNCLCIFEVTLYRRYQAWYGTFIQTTLGFVFALLVNKYKSDFFFPVCFESRCFCSNFSVSKALELLLQGNGSTTNTDFHFEHSQKTTHSLMTCMRNLPILTSSSRVYCNGGGCVNEKERFGLACRGLNMLQP